MTFLPIVFRELRVSSRRRATYWLRSGAGLIVVIAGTWLFIMMQSEPPRSIGSGLFYILTGCAVLYALLSGLRTTADCLSEEKREGTLGLLFLTDLKGYDVILGKLLASSLNAFYSVVAVLPMLAIPLLMGGVTPGEFARLSLLTVNTLFFAAGIGMAVSSASRLAHRAMLAAALAALFFTALLPGVVGLFYAFGKTSLKLLPLLLPSVGFTFFSGLETPAYAKAPQMFWISMAVVHGLGWVFLVFASLMAPRVWQDRPATSRDKRLVDRWNLWSFGDVAERNEFRRGLLERNAFLWLASRSRIKPALVWSFLALIGCCWVWGLAKARRAWLEPGMYLTTGLFLNFALRCWVASEATRQLSEDRKQGTLELLLSTPLTVKEILRGQRLALARQFLGPVALVLGIEFIFMLATVQNEFGGEAFFLVVMYLCGMAMFVFDLYAIYWVGMWQGLSARNQSRAISNTLSRIMVFPWILMALVIMVVALMSFAGGGPDTGGWFFLTLWGVAGVLTDAGFGFHARHRLLTDFRTTAQQRFEKKAGFWKRLVSG